MEVSGFIPVFFLGAFGGVAIETLRWWRLRTQNQLPDYLNKPHYWLITLAMILVSGLLASLYGITERSAIMVVNLGASAPALLAAFTRPPEEQIDFEAERSGSHLPQPERQKRGNPSVRAFLSFGG